MGHPTNARNHDLCLVSHQDLINRYPGPYDLTMPVQVPSDAICMQCKYRLYGLPEPRCPECGRAFDPRDSATYLASSTPRWANWAQPPHPFLSLLVVGVTGLLILDGSKPYPFDLSAICLALVLGGIALLDWAVRAAAWVELMGHRVARSYSQGRRPRWHWFIFPVCAILISSARVMDWPLRVRFWVSLPAFESAVVELKRSGATSAGPRRVGLYRVKGMNVSPAGNFTFSIGMRGFFPDDAGFLFAPPGTIPNEHSTTLLMGNWWTYIYF